MPICLITGFLGAGKTTLVNHILTNSQGLCAAVFVNEYGATDVDGALVRWQGGVDEDRVVTLSNGCVCCQVNDDLARQLSKLLAARRDSIDVVIIETSGVCDPEPVLATLHQIEDIDEVHLDSVVCVVDATTLRDSELGSSTDARRQLAHADVVLLNKVDLLPDSKAAESAERCLLAACVDQAVEPPHAVLHTVHARVDLAALCGLTARNMAVSPSPAKRRRMGEVDPGPGGWRSLKQAIVSLTGRRGVHTQFATFVYAASQPFDMMKFENWAAVPPKGVLRAKGLLWVKGIPRHVAFHLAGRRTNPFETLRSTEPPQGSVIVFIGRDGAMDQQSIREGLEKCLC